MQDDYSFDFEGNGFALLGTALAEGEAEYVFDAELYVDGELVETAILPTQFTKRRFYLFWKYQLPVGQHRVDVRLLNPSDAARVELNGVVIYDDTPLS